MWTALVVAPLFLGGLACVPHVWRRTRRAFRALLTNAPMIPVVPADVAP